MNSLKKIRLEISHNLTKLGGQGPILVHSDVMGALGLIEKKFNSLEILKSFLHKALKELPCAAIIIFLLSITFGLIFRSK